MLGKYYKVFLKDTFHASTLTYARTKAVLPYRQLSDLKKNRLLDFI